MIKIVFQVQQDDNKNLLVARILEGGMIEKQGLLHIGDVILEVNGTPVNTPEDLQVEIAKSRESVTLKVGQVDSNDVGTHAALVANGAVNGVGRKLVVCDNNRLYHKSTWQASDKESYQAQCLQT